MNTKHWGVAYPNGQLIAYNTEREARRMCRQYNIKHNSKGYFDRAMTVQLEPKQIEKRISVLKTILNYVIGRY